MKTLNRTTGRRAEDHAAKMLRKKGYSIIAQNYGNKFGEIDIIAQDKQTLVFVEVKAKTGTQFGTPEEMVNPKKLHKVRRMALDYLRGQTSTCRIDIVAVVLGEDEEIVRITHYENVY